MESNHQRGIVMSSTFTIRPATPETWPDLERLFGPRGACAGCWCLYWRLGPQESKTQTDEENRLGLKSLVESATPPGLLAYAGDLAVAWLALAPREDYPKLQRSRVLKPVDDEEVWSITCFFTHKNYRNQGLNRALILAAIEYVRAHGGKILEGYPVEVNAKTSPVFVFTGIASAFTKLGFVEVARRSPTRPIMRYIIE
jgi:GNAT superfamily N-acetyltransferase